LEEEVAVLGRTLGEELLEPTEIYVRAVRALWSADVPTRGLAHVTGDGLANLCRLDAPVGYAIEHLPPPHQIFRLIQEEGAIEDAEMFRVFNMGIGFAVIVPAPRSSAATEIIEACGLRAERIGTVTDEPGRLRIEPLDLVGGLEDTG